LKEIYPVSNRELFVEQNLDFILGHLQNPLFPRRIMTKRLGYQKEVLDKQSVLKYFRSSNYEDCRVNAYPSFTNFHGVNRTPPSFIITDLDLKDFGYSKDKLDGALNNALKRIKDILDGYPTVLWTGNGYHIYQPLEGFVLEEVDIFAEFVGPTEKDLTSKFMEFAEDFLTNKKGDPQHNPTINSCLIRIPGTINSKCKEEVKIIQKWDGYRPQINYLLRDFRRWLINEKIVQQKLSSKERGRGKSVGASRNNTTIPWIEKLLQTPVDDYRKFAIWRILAPYLINIKGSSIENAFTMIRDWLNKCNSLRQLDFNPNYIVKYNINSAQKAGYLPISLDKLKMENSRLHNLVAHS
jgi:Primase X